MEDTIETIKALAKKLNASCATLNISTDDGTLVTLKVLRREIVHPLEADPAGLAGEQKEGPEAEKPEEAPEENPSGGGRTGRKAEEGSRVVPAQKEAGRWQDQGTQGCRMDAEADWGGNEVLTGNGNFPPEGDGIRKGG